MLNSIFKVGHLVFRGSTRNYLVNPYYGGPDFTCSDGDFLEILTDLQNVKCPTLKIDFDTKFLTDFGKLFLKVT